ncbi:MAG: acetoacetate metabolism regulatory protein AtoC [bacterium]|nr:MAG: acetoacetate metabolism regulatory protein AtoC [bacterium]
MNPKILVVDNDKSVSGLIARTLDDGGFEVTVSRDGGEAFDLCKKNIYDIVIYELRMPRVDGLEFLKLLKREGYTPSVIMVTASASVESAVESMKMGAVDYMIKPVNGDRLVSLVNREIKIRSLQYKVSMLEYQTRDKYKLDKIIGKSAAMHEVFEKIIRVSNTDSTVLIQGETGTGKELVAAAIHTRSHRSNEPFVCVNMGALAETILESELFGHVKGAFTGALYDRKGKFELAGGGTIFLDEIGELSPALQVKLLRVIQERCFERVGGSKTIHVDIRIIAATNKNLDEEVKKKMFRSDLFYRLNIFPIHVPLLHERKEDIPLLASHFLQEKKGVTRKNVSNISPAALDRIVRYSWPGNVRELENVIERAMITAKNSTLDELEIPDESRVTTREKLPESGGGDDVSVNTLTEYLESREKEYFVRLLTLNRGSISKTAYMAGINANTLYKKMKKLNLRKEEYKFE